MIKFIILLPAIFACTVSARGQLKFGTALIEDRIDSSKQEFCRRRHPKPPKG